MYLNSWSDNWAATSTDDGPTFADLQRVMREFQAKHKDRGPDVWVLTHDEWMKLRLHCQVRDQHDIRRGIAGYQFLDGIRIEECATRDEVRARVNELAEQDVKAGFLNDETVPAKF